MLQYSFLDRIFHALSDPTRRAIVERLMSGPATVSELAMPFPVSLSAIGQHVQLLQVSGIVRTTKVGRVRTVELSLDSLELAECWFREHRERRSFRPMSDCVKYGAIGSSTKPLSITRPATNREVI